MRLSHRHRFIFFSNPKTGSESVRRLLDPYSDVKGVPYWEKTEERPFYTHIRPVEVREIFRRRGLDFGQYYKFTFVRNPWARLVSLYEMIHGNRRHRGITGRLPERLRNALRLHPSARGFQRWLRSVRPDGRGAGGAPDQRWQVYGTYSIDNFAGDENGDLLVERIIRLEDIDQALPDTLREMGLREAAERSVPRINTGDHRSYVSYYDEQSAELVRRRYEFEIRRFNYRFGQ